MLFRSVNVNLQKMEMIMYKNKLENGRNNISGLKIKEIRQKLPTKTSQRKLAEMLQIQGLDLDKNAIQRIESGQRFVTDIELKVISKILDVSSDDLLNI